MNSFKSHYENEKKRMTNDCIACGLCIKACPIVSKTNLKEMKPAEIQEQCLAFLRKGVKSDAVYTRGFSCMECFRCSAVACPRGLNPWR